MSFIWFIFLLALNFAHSRFNFTTLYEWKQIEYEFESEEQRTAAIANGSFNIGQVQPIDVQHTNIKLPAGGNVVKNFITTPRITLTGVPASLSVISNKTLNGNPVIQPYPHWSWHIDLKKCNEKRIVSAFRVWKDECDRLWVIDTGILGIGTNLICSPQILAFDLLTDELIYKYEVPQSIHKYKSEYHAITAEVLHNDKSCSDTWIYAADPDASTLLVYSLKLNQAWGVEDTTFKPSEKWANVTIAGDSFPGAYGIVSVALSPLSDGEKRKLSYHALSNINESYVYTKELRNVSLLENGVGDIFHTYANSRTQQSDSEAYDQKGRLYFSLLSDANIVRWIGKSDYGSENFEIIADDRKTMQFPTAIKIGKYLENTEELWVFSTRLHKWGSDKLSPNETNFRILYTNILD